jgi:hypothetical protein
MPMANPLGTNKATCGVYSGAPPAAVLPLRHRLKYHSYPQHRPPSLDEGGFLFSTYDTQSILPRVVL